MNERIYTSIYIFLFVLGLAFIANSTNYRENFTHNNEEDNNCPNRIIKKNDGIYIYNTRKAEVPGVNPIKFDNLEEYVEYIEWLKSQNINCPILFYKEIYNTQNKKQLKHDPELSIYPDFSEEQGHAKLTDAGRNPDSPFNRNMYPGFDPQNQYIGKETKLDDMFVEHEGQGKSDNPMDPNWGGQNMTEKSIESGKYDENIIVA